MTMPGLPSEMTIGNRSRPTDPRGFRARPIAIRDRPAARIRIRTATIWSSVVFQRPRCPSTVPELSIFYGGKRSLPSFWLFAQVVVFARLVDRLRRWFAGALVFESRWGRQRRRRIYLPSESSSTG